MNSLGKLSVTAKCDADTLAEILDGIDEVREYTEELAEVGYSRFTLNFEPENDPSESIFFAFADKKIAIVDMSHERMTLEDIFLKLTEADARSEEKLDEAEGDEYTPLFTEDEIEEEAEEETPEEEETNE